MTAKLYEIIAVALLQLLIAPLLITQNFFVTFSDYSLDCITNPSLENPVVIYAQDPGLTFLSIVYAEMWKCSDNSAINCPIQRSGVSPSSEYKYIV